MWLVTKSVVFCKKLQRGKEISGILAGLEQFNCHTLHYILICYGLLWIIHTWGFELWIGPPTSYGIVLQINWKKIDAKTLLWSYLVFNEIFGAQDSSFPKFYYARRSCYPPKLHPAIPGQFQSPYHFQGLLPEVAPTYVEQICPCQSPRTIRFRNFTQSTVVFALPRQLPGQALTDLTVGRPQDPLPPGIRSRRGVSSSLSRCQLSPAD